MLRDSWIGQFGKVRRIDRDVQRYARQALYCRKRMLHGFAEMSDLELFAWSGGLALLLASRSGSHGTGDGQQSGSPRLRAVALFGWQFLMRARTMARMLERVRRAAVRDVPPSTAGEERRRAG